jgi:hypothetical protein
MGITQHADVAARRCRATCAGTRALSARTRGARAGILNLFGGVLIQKRRAEVALERSGLPYVIVRPGGMERPGDDWKDTHNVRLAPRDKLFGGQVSRLQVAELIAAAVASPKLVENKARRQPPGPRHKLVCRLSWRVVKQHAPAAPQSCTVHTRSPGSSTPCLATPWRLVRQRNAPSGNTATQALSLVPGSDSTPLERNCEPLPSPDFLSRHSMPSRAGARRGSRCWRWWRRQRRRGCPTASCWPARCARSRRPRAPSASRPPRLRRPSWRPPPSGCAAACLLVVHCDASSECCMLAGIC